VHDERGFGVFHLRFGLLAEQTGDHHERSGHVVQRVEEAVRVRVIDVELHRTYRNAVARFEIGTIRC
jgi:hypothetical protein